MFKVEEEGLFRSDLQKPINVFTGAGFSVLAKNALNQTLPVGERLKSDIIQRFDIPQLSDLDLASIYAFISSDRRDELRSFLQETFTVCVYDKRYDALRKLDVEYLYTTNIDDLPFHIFDARHDDTTRILHDVYTLGTPREQQSVTQFISLHGNVRHEDSDFIFTSGRISSAFASDRETWYVFQRALRDRPTIFLGYSMKDAGVLQALESTTERSLVNKWIVLRRDDQSAEAFYRSMGFHVAVGDIADFLAYVEQLEKAPREPLSPSRSRFHGEVPRSAEVAQRPVKSFFLGSEPEWSDAYSPQVVRRRVNDLVKNSIYSGNHVAIVGLPLSGKSTILRQVASDIAQERPALYFERISDPQIEKVIAEQKSALNKSLIFVDNLIDSREAIDRISNEIGAQFVCAEDSQYFDSVNLRSLSPKLDVISSSDIEGNDLQSIIDSIPAEVRRWNPDRLDVVEADLGEVGLFESFRRHVFDEGLTDRFRQKLADFEMRNQESFDVYMMAAYVAGCRTIVSFDMIYMFIDRARKAYGDVYEVTRSVHGFMAEVSLIDDPHQDYFSVRSGALARIALRQCSNRAFGRMFERFHSAVPSRTIVDYPVFRRYAYDNDFARKAYPRVEDGLRFYKRLVGFTDNAYDYQHGAIYLSKMKSFSEAFNWIDTALSKSNGRVYAIRNTHARILFEANIDVARLDQNDQTALDGICQSMKVLQEIIVKDQRRSYHLLRFSDQALQYAEIFDDEDAEAWLIVAREKLKDIVEQAAVSRSRESYNLKKYRNLLREVSTALSERGIRG
tara:strand:- start:139 stop:2508 length:2370 start_codon:yes stop_codon:yes gene_type:complete